MAAPFAFLPRAVSKHPKAQPVPPPKPAPPPALPSDSDSNSDSGSYDDDSEWSGIATPLDKGKGRAESHSKQSTIQQDIASLISLALSDYNIWLDGDLRHKLDECLRHADSPDSAGFVPINYLIRRTPFRSSSSAQTDPSETDVVKALRIHATDTLDVRMLVSAPSSSFWYGPGKTSRKKDVGNYEVRRKDWAGLLERPSRSWSQARWDDQMVYMECVPVQYRTVGGIARFTESLLPPLPESRIIVQNVTLPPHHLDRPGDIPKCRGYALVTLSTKAQAETIRRDWPWKRRTLGSGRSENERACDADASPAVKEALKFGFRTISKARWEKLNEEYLIYKQQLVEEIARTQPSEPLTHYLAAEGVPEGEPIEHQSIPQPFTAPKTTLSSPYPLNCLIFVRNTHPETNKTTLKGLFSQAFQGELAAGLDYIDFNKGMDTCYLRLASPHHTTVLMEFFREHPIAQTHGLDGSGRKPKGDDKPLMVEIIQGKKEELYWEKVPEKVRRQAVEKAVRDRATESSIPPTSLPQNTLREHKKRKQEQRF